MGRPKEDFDDHGIDGKSTHDPATNPLDGISLVPLFHDPGETKNLADEHPEAKR